MNKWQVNIKIWRDDIKIWQVNIIIWQVMAVRPLVQKETYTHKETKLNIKKAYIDLLELNGLPSRKSLHIIISSMRLFLTYFLHWG